MSRLAIPMFVYNASNTHLHVRTHTSNHHRYTRAHALAYCPFYCAQGFNSSAEKLWGFNVTDVAGRNVKMLMSFADAERHDNHLTVCVLVLIVCAEYVLCVHMWM